MISVSEDQLTCGPLPTKKNAAKTLGTLKIDSATGPDLLPTRILRECAVQLAKPFRLLAALILQYQTWPRAWKVHWVVPLYKSNRIFCHLKLQRNSLDSADFQSHGKIPGLHVHDPHVHACMRRSKSIRVPEGSRGP